MDLTTSAVNDWVVVTLPVKRLDVSAASEVKKELAILVESGARYIGLDLSDVEYVDSAGLGAMVHILKLLRQRGRLVLIGSSDKVRGLLELTGLDRIFHTADSADDLELVGPHPMPSVP